MYDLVKLTHLVAAIIWLGGMTFMLIALRPAVMGALERPERLRLMGAVWKRFFAVVVASIVVVLATGTNLYTTVFRTMKMATGTGSVPLGWNLMLGIGLLMMLIFAHIFFAGYAKFKRAAAATDWPLADQAAAQIHALTVTNFVLGWLALLAVRLVH